MRGGQRSGAGRQRHRGRVGAAAGALACSLTLTIAIAAGALAQAGAPGPACGEAAADLVADPGCAGVDSAATPVAKPSAAWRQVGGSPFRASGGGTTETVPGSPTTVATDLFSVAFRNAAHGLVGGATCSTPPSRELEADALARYLAGCRRVPVVYEFEERARAGARWREHLLGRDAGYVAAVAWLGPGEAIAVGGTGTPSPTCEYCGYPRREQGDVTAPGYDDPAGRPRAWLYASGRWREIAGLPEEMSALTAVSCRESDRWCVAGGLGQLWDWRDGSFVEGFGAGLEGELSEPFAFRVRDVQLVAPARSVDWQPISYPEGYAVTSGCCADRPESNVPRVLTYDATSRRWTAQAARTHAALGLDSLYSVTVGRASNAAPVPGVVLSPGGVTNAAEPTSTMATLHYTGGSEPFDELASIPLDLSSGDRSLSSVRLVAAAGAAARRETDPQPPDLAVGELRSTGQGIAYDRLASPPPAGYDLGDPANGREPQARADEVASASRSYRLAALPSYALNAVDMPSPVAGGETWAAGDRGAIVRRVPSADDVASRKPAPSLGPAAPARLPDDSPYAAFRPLEAAARAGTVPALAGRAILPGRGFEAFGSPDATQRGQRAGERVATMSFGADGAGWAVGPGARDGAPLTTYRFDGTAWHRCDDEPVLGGAVLAADDACADLAPLRARGLVLAGVAAVDPRSERQEAVAVGWLPAQGDQATSAVILRYRGGRWAREDAPAHSANTGQRYRLQAVAFTGPDDGWAYGTSAVDEGAVVILRFADGRWIGCRADPSRCADEDGALPLRNHAPPVSGPALVAAGDRVFLAGTRTTEASSTPTGRYPVVLSRRRGGSWGTDHGFDPAGRGRLPDPADQARMTSFGVARSGDAGLVGWARLAPADGGRSHSTLTLSPTGAWRTWSPRKPRDALANHPDGAEVGTLAPTDDGAAMAVMTTRDGPLLRYDPQRDRWRALPAPFHPDSRGGATHRRLQALAPDGQGGLWVAHEGDEGGPSFHRYGGERRAPVFEDVPQPFAGKRVRHLAATADGTVWLAGDAGSLARYDRLTGWSTVRVPGWDRGPLPLSAVTAVAVAPDGSGVAVGEGGRIADVSALGARLDAAAGRLCSAHVPPCATGETLRAVDVARDGSALAGGDRAALLWRPAHGPFRTIPAPAIASSTQITAVALPAPDRAWIATDRGEVFAARRSGDAWSWGPPENLSRHGDLLSSAGEGRGAWPLRAIDVDASGRGYAVGDSGTVLERTGDEDQPWRRVSLGIGDDLTAVALAAGRGEGALIGGEAGAVWTRVGGRLQAARPANVVDGYAGHGGARVSGLAVLPGLRDGDAEAWVALDGRLTGGALLHYASDPGEPVLAPAKPVRPLPDSPARRPGELRIAAFGKSDCIRDGLLACPGPSGTDSVSDVASRRIVEALRREAIRSPSPQVAVFTGDVTDHGGDVAQVSRSARLDEWVDLVAHELEEAGVPVLGALGSRDLSEARACVDDSRQLCAGSGQVARAGTNSSWRQAMAGRAGQDDGPRRFADVELRPVGERSLADGPGDLAPLGRGARTHYAVDVVRDARALARIAVVDNSLGSLAASDPFQHPADPRGQRAWLDRVLATRPPGLPAVVVATSPTYTYRPTTAAETATDGAALEAQALAHRVSAVVSGRVGWNALYYALAPGLHCPGPGGSYPDRPPADVGACRAARTPAPSTDPVEDLARTLQGVEAPAAPGAATEGDGSRAPSAAVPFAISSGAGGNLAEPSGEGYWHGYSIVRVDRSGDPARTIVEQRPIFDWLVLTAPERTLRAHRTMTLRGVGRQPPSADAPPRFHRISGPSITHRYDLLLADPQRPWLPLRGPEGRYVALADRHPGCSVACVDSSTGTVRTGGGASTRVYAVATLSVGDLVATYPLVLEPGRPMSPAGGPPARSQPGAAPSSSGRLAGGPAAPPTASADFASRLPPGAGAPPAPPPHAGAREPKPPSRAASPTVPTSVAPPTPTAWRTPAGDALHVTPRAVPRPPSAPAAQPAPPAVTVRGRERELESPQPGSASDPDGPSVEPRPAFGRIDLANAPPMPDGAAATRRAHDSPRAWFSVRARSDQPSAWATGALHGGGIILAAVVLGSAWAGIRRGRRDYALEWQAGSTRGER
jgi:hypothetical protein